MKNNCYLRFALLIVLTIYTISANSQAPFSHGVNLTGWFQVNSPGQIQFTKFTKQDIINIKSLGMRCYKVTCQFAQHDLRQSAVHS